MTRKQPQMRTAWVAGDDGKKPYSTHMQAYYAIAKELVIAKYPPWLSDIRTDAEAWRLEPRGTFEGFERELIERRRAKAEVLYYDEDGLFDPDRWKVFVRRVSKYLRFVDMRANTSPLTLHHLRLRDVEAATLEVRYQECEKNATDWMTLAKQYRDEISRRGFSSNNMEHANEEDHRRNDAV